MLRAVIFDFDGVISDSEPLHLRAFNEILAQAGIEITEQAYYEEYLGFTDLDCLKAIADKYRLGLDTAGIEKLIDRKSRVFEELIKTEDSIIEGVPEFLRMLKENNVRIAICSGALRGDIEVVFSGTDLSSFFDVIVTADDVEKGKPDPEGFLLALQRLNEAEQDKIAPGECVVIEDSHWGLEAATKAGMHTVAVASSYKAEELTMADKVIANLTALSMRQLNDLCA